MLHNLHATSTEFRNNFQIIIWKSMTCRDCGKHFVQRAVEKQCLLFFLRNCHYNYNKIHISHGYILYKFQIIFWHSLHYQHTFPTFAWDTVCQSHKTIYWSVRALHTCRFISSSFTKQHPWRPKWWEVGRC